MTDLRGDAFVSSASPGLNGAMREGHRPYSKGNLASAERVRRLS
jgi:hypothetical protein